MILFLGLVVRFQEFHELDRRGRQNVCLQKSRMPMAGLVYIVACHLPRAPSYCGVRTWVEGSHMRVDRALAGASNLLGYKENYQQQG